MKIEISDARVARELLINTEAHTSAQEDIRMSILKQLDEELRSKAWCKNCGGSITLEETEIKSYSGWYHLVSGRIQCPGSKKAYVAEPNDLKTPEEVDQDNGVTIEMDSSVKYEIIPDARFPGLAFVQEVPHKVFSAIKLNRNTFERIYNSTAFTWETLEEMVDENVVIVYRTADPENVRAYTPKTFDAHFKIKSMTGTGDMYVEERKLGEHLCDGWKTP